MVRAYAIGDIHGQLDALIETHDLIADDMAQHGYAPTIHIGDLVDRGPESAGVVEYLRLGITQKEEWVVLKGNHDLLFTSFMSDPETQHPLLSKEYTWLHPRVGGADTLLSYGIENPAERSLSDLHSQAKEQVPQEHIDFLTHLPTWHRAVGATFVHAGIRPGIPLTKQSDDDLLWIRKGFLECKNRYPELIVHGHTAIEAPCHYGNRLNIDSGAAYGGKLSAVVLEPEGVFLLTASGRIYLPPGPYSGGA